MRSKMVLKKLFYRYHHLSEYSGKIFGLMAILIMGLISFEVCARYFFRHPTSWGWDITSHILGLYILFAGIYTMSQDEHIKIEMVYNLMPPHFKQIARWIGLICFVFFMVVLIWKGFQCPQVRLAAPDLLFLLMS